MNAKVQEFIDKMKEIEKTKKEEKLISLGLIDESKTITKRKTIDVDQFTTNAKYDSINKEYYVETNEYFAIDVTDEEYQEILKYSSVV